MTKNKVGGNYTNRKMHSYEKRVQIKMGLKNIKVRLITYQTTHEQPK